MLLRRIAEHLKVQNWTDDSVKDAVATMASMALNDSLFAKSLQTGHSMQILNMGIWEGTLVVAEQMCEKIAQYSGRECAALDQGVNRDQEHE